MAGDGVAGVAVAGDGVAGVAMVLLVFILVTLFSDVMDKRLNEKMFPLVYFVHMRFLVSFLATRLMKHQSI